MDIYILNKEFRFVTLIDNYQSIIWTERYFEAGDFEISLPLLNKYVSGESSIQQDYYVTTSDSSKLMIVEKREIKKNIEDQSSFIISGRSIESVLDRRIVWKFKKWVLQSPIDIMYDIVSNSLVGESCKYARVEQDKTFYPDRVIPYLTIDKSNRDELISYMARNKSPNISKTCEGDNVYELITEMCKKYYIGFEITYKENPTDATPILTFRFYHGENRSEKQDLIYDKITLENGEKIDNPNGHYKNQVVDLSEKFDNCNASEYTNDKSQYKNFALVGGYGEETSRLYATRVDTVCETPVGLDRRETFVNSNDSVLINDDVKDSYMSICLSKLKAKYEEITNAIKYIDETPLKKYVDTTLKFYPNEGNVGLLVDEVTVAPINSFKKYTKPKENSDDKGPDITSLCYISSEQFKVDNKGVVTTCLDPLAPNTNKTSWNIYYYSERDNRYLWTGKTANSAMEKSANKFISISKKLDKVRRSGKDISTSDSYDLQNNLQAFFAFAIEDFPYYWSRNIWGDPGYYGEGEKNFLDSYSMESVSSVNDIIASMRDGALSPFVFYLVPNGKNIDIYIVENPDSKDGNYGRDKLMYGRWHEVMCNFMPVCVKEMPQEVRVVNTETGPVYVDTYDTTYTRYEDGQFSKYLYFEYSQDPKAANALKAWNNYGRDITAVEIYDSTYHAGFRRLEKEEWTKTRFPFANKNILIYLGSMKNELEGTATDKSSSYIGKGTIEDDFTADIEFNGTYRINEDYFIGDVVSISNEYGDNSGIPEVAIVTEIIKSYEDSGSHIVPTLKLISDY